MKIHYAKVIDLSPKENYTFSLGLKTADQIVKRIDVLQGHLSITYSDGVRQEFYGMPFITRATNE